MQVDDDDELCVEWEDGNESGDLCDTLGAVERDTAKEGSVRDEKELATQEKVVADDDVGLEEDAAEGTLGQAGALALFAEGETRGEAQSDPRRQHRRG